MRRADPRRIYRGKPDAGLSSLAGLVPFGRHLRRIGFDSVLQAACGHMKSGPGVVYPMPVQIRNLIDAQAAGEPRVFGFEHLAADPLFVKLAGGHVPSLDTLYRDLGRFQAPEILVLESLVARYGLPKKQLLAHHTVHLDLDTSVEPVFGRQQGAEVGYNPRYRGRPSYHPLLAALAETRTCVGALLRPGNTSLGEQDADTVAKLVRRTRAALRPWQSLRVRVDAGGDCTELLSAIEDEGELFVVKARLTRDLCQAIYRARAWQTVEQDSEGVALRQVAEVDFQRKEWQERGRRFRVVAVRCLEKYTGKQVQLWPHLDWVVEAYITNDWRSDADFIAYDYQQRAEVELLIREWKHDLGIGAVPRADFDSNHAMLLIKLLTHNLLRDFFASRLPQLSGWRLCWLRRLIICVPARLLRSGNSIYLRLPLHSPAYHLLC